MRSTCVGIAVLSAGLAWNATAAAQNAPADWAQARQQRIDALAKGDRAAFDRLTAENFVVVDPTGRVENKAERGARVTPPANPGRGGGGVAAPRVNERIAVYNNDTVVVFWQTKTPAGMMNFMETWVRDGGQWKCASAHISRPDAGGGAGRGREGGRS